MTGEKDGSARSLPERFASRIVVGPSGCWEWLGGRGKNNYPNSTSWQGKKMAVYRIVYTVLVGEIPAGFDIDHLCRNHGCLKPSHLEAVTHKENLRRGHTVNARNVARTHCKRGHEFTPENTYVWRPGTPQQSRCCRTCRKAKLVAWHAARRAAA